MAFIIIKSLTFLLKILKSNEKTKKPFAISLHCWSSRSEDSSPEEQTIWVGADRKVDKTGRHECTFVPAKRAGESLVEVSNDVTLMNFGATLALLGPQRHTPPILKA